MSKKELPPTPEKQYNHLTTLIAGVKSDSIMQFGEMKKEFGAFSTRQDDHNRRITALETDKIKREAVDDYKKSQTKPEKSGNKESVTINKELLQALKYLGLVIAALAAAIIGLKIKP